MIDMSEAGGSDRCMNGLRIIYDGECFLCSAYVQMLRLKETVGTVHLVNARDIPEQIEQLAASGIDLDQTMVVQYGGQIYTGPRAVELLSLMSTRSGFFNRLSAVLLGGKRRADLLYPALRMGRNAVLFLRGRRNLRS